jgi:archaellum component FlaF (FlaF/FlaG flagellin family)
MGNGATEVNGPITDLICDATVTVNASSDPRTVTITYNGSNCRGNRTRTGVVEISIPSGIYWKNAGAAVTITVKNLKITRVRDNKSIVLNGTKTISNVSGGLLVDLATLGTITHTISGDLSITFDNGSQRTWQVAKQRVFTYDNGIVITTTGTHSDGTNTGIAEWGTNRFGVSFTSLITAPKVFRQDCDFRLTSGQNTIIRADNTSTITYGLDANGDATGCPGTGTYYFKIVWTNSAGVSFTKILPY